MTTPGQILDAQGLELELDDDDLIDGAVVVLRIRKGDGSTTVQSANTEGLDFITMRGLLEIALDGERLDVDDFEGGPS